MIVLSRFILAALFAVPLLSAVPGAAEETLYFQGEANGLPRRAEAALIEVHGVPYVSLSRLAESLGGGVRVYPTRIQIDFLGHSAAVGIGDTTVNSSLNQFSVLYPIAALDGDVLLSARDVEPFFEQAFGLTLDRAQPDAESGAEAAAMAPPIETAAAAPPIETPAAATPGGVEVRELPAEETSPLAEAAPALDLPPPAAELPAAAETPVSAEPAAEVPPISGIEAIVLDAGHGGEDPGYAGPGGAIEKDIALDIARQLRDLLKEQTALSVFLTREKDTAMTAAERAAFANRQDADLLICIHGGVSMSARARGIAVFYPDTASGASAAGARPFAWHAADELARATGAAIRMVQAADLRIFDGLRMPAIMLEPGCLTNPAEESLLITEAYRRSIAEGIAAALARAAQGTEDAADE